MSAPNWWGDWRPILTPHTGNLQPTDLLECTSIVGGLPVNTAITGAQIIAAASGGSGLTVGTTGITSGTIGRVLFQGTGNVLQQSANLFWDNTNNRLGIGTSTPTKTFDLRGDANIISADNLGGNTLSVFANNLTQGIGISYNTISLIGSSSNINLTLSPKGTGMLLITSSITQVNNLGQVYAFGNSINGNYGTNANSSLILNYSGASAGTTHFRDTLIYNGKAAQIAQFTGSTGNFLINTSTDAGFKLDVNGTARVQGNLDVSGSNILTTRYLNMNSALGLSRIEYSYSGGTLLQLGRMQGAAGLTRQFDIISKTPNYGVTSQQILTLFPSASIKYDNSAATSSTIATETASACFEVFSTTKGFLPPRMTNAQMLAIATPAAGLVVYDTTNNKHCGYNGTAWQNFY